MPSDRPGRFFCTVPLTARSPAISFPPIFARSLTPRHDRASPAEWNDDDDEPAGGVWQGVSRFFGRASDVLVGTHGVFTHFPVLVIGLIGITMVMHRHWPASTKMLASVTVGGSVTIVLLYCLSHRLGRCHVCNALVCHIPSPAVVLSAGKLSLATPSAYVVDRGWRVVGVQHGGVPMSATPAPSRAADLTAIPPLACSESACPAAYHGQRTDARPPVIASLASASDHAGPEVLRRPGLFRGTIQADGVPLARREALWSELFAGRRGNRVDQAKSAWEPDEATKRPGLNMIRGGAVRVFPGSIRYYFY